MVTLMCQLCLGIFLLFCVFDWSPAIADEYCVGSYKCIDSTVCRKLHVGKKLPIIFACKYDEDFVCCPPVSKVTETDINYLSTRNEDDLAQHRNFALVSGETCGLTPVLGTKIIDGQEAILGEFPWMAMLMYHEREKPEFVTPLCGGTLINERYVLTAAHCFAEENFIFNFVRLGEHNTLKDEDCDDDVCYRFLDVSVEGDPIIHEDWNLSTLKNDIALLRLSVNVLANAQPNINPICLPTNKGVQVSNNMKLEVTGWGLTNHLEQIQSNVLRKTNLYNKDLSICKTCRSVSSRTRRYCPLSPSQLCAQGELKEDVCKGDSGGPITVLKSLRTYQVGITSFKSTEVCGQQNVPSIFTNVTYHLRWILDHIKP